MSKIGFVYILANEYMPDVYKVGCTERSPHERAAELSASTGVPAPFKVLCYIECVDFQSMEKKFHEWLSDYRISNGREFFYDGLGLAIRLLYWFRGGISFAIPKSSKDAIHDAISEEMGWSGVTHLGQTQDPWEKKTAVDASVEAVVAAAASAAAVAHEERADGGGIE